MKTSQRSCGIQLGTIKEGLDESPPPAPAATSLREWFAGLALANPVLMNKIPVAERVKEAVRLADELSLALAAPRVVNVDSLNFPTSIELASWERDIIVDNEKAIRQRLDTVPACPETNPSRQAFLAILPPSPSSERGSRQ